MPDARIRLRQQDEITIIELDNPARHNALGAAEVAEFLRLLDAVAQAADTRALIITNPAGNTFCAGAALDELTRGALTSNGFAALPNRIDELGIPTIAAMNGNAFGGGTEIALACDFRIGTAAMKIHVPPARLSLCYPVSGIERFVTRLGVTTAKQLLVANEEFSGEQLYQRGFLTHLTPPAQVGAEALKLAARIASLGPLAVTTMKGICNSLADGSFDRQRALAAEQRCNQSADFHEGLQAVAEKRQPRFRGR